MCKIVHIPYAITLKSKLNIITNNNNKYLTDLLQMPFYYLSYNAVKSIMLTKIKEIFL